MARDPLPSPGARHRYRVLAGSLLTLELVGGIQSIALTAVVPAAVTDLDAGRWYGAVVATPLAAMFVTLPAGAALLARVRSDRLFWLLTGVSVSGSTLCALAPGPAVLVGGRVVSGLAAGALSSVSLSAVATVLPDRQRRVVLAGYSVVWMGAAVAGPAYAAGVAGTFGWRWAFVAYLPLLVAARGTAARELRHLPGERAPATYRARPAALLALGVAVLTVASSTTTGDGPSRWLVLTMGGGAAGATLLAAARLLPSGTLHARPGRPALLATLGLTTAAYFGAQAVFPIAMHALLRADVAQVAVTAAAGGLGWAAAGAWSGARPTRSTHAYVRRVTAGSACLALGIVGAGAATTAHGAAAVPATVTAWTVAGVGTGLVYLDTLRRALDPGLPPDGMSAAQAATAASLVEGVATALAASVAAGVVGGAVAGAGSGQGTVAVSVVALAGVAASAMWAARRTH